MSEGTLFSFIGFKVWGRVNGTWTGYLELICTTEPYPTLNPTLNRKPYPTPRVVRVSVGRGLGRFKAFLVWS